MMPDPLVNMILLLAGVQGLFLALILLHKFRTFYANRFLALLMFLCGVILLNLYRSETVCSYRFSLVNLFMIGVTFLLTPTQYLYTRFLLRPSDRLSLKDLVHLLPMLLYWFSLAPLLAIPPDQIGPYLTRSVFHGIPWRFILFNFALALAGIVYMAFTLYRLHQFRAGLSAVVSSLEKMQLQWLQTITLLSLFSWVLFAGENGIFMLCDLENYGFGISSAFSGVFIYLLGYWGLLKSDWLLKPQTARTMEQVGQEAGWEDGKRREARKYEKSGLSPERSQDYLDALLAVMEEQRPYLDSELSLPQLAELISITPHHLSEVLNARLQQTFFDFINHYRIEQVKKDLVDPRKQSMKILALAFEAGFSSKTAFNTLFKKHTGLTPSQYRDRCGSSSRS